MAPAAATVIGPTEGPNARSQHLGGMIQGMTLWNPDIQIADMQPRPQHELLAEALQRAIALGQLSPGDQLPTERAMAEKLGLGRMTVGRAMRALADDGFVAIRRGRNGGAFVSDGPRTDTKSRRAQAVRQFGEDMQHNYEFRLSIEPTVARLAAERATPVQRNRLAELAEQEPDSLAKYRAADSQFHLLVADACGNALFAHAVREARAQFFAWADTLWMLNGELTHDTDVFGRQHRGIGEAIISGDGDRAEALMREHLSASRNSYEATLRANDMKRPRKAAATGKTRSRKVIKDDN
jgi:GntR family transcriptional repressor for pyruvate dehydrogenase complex